MQAKYQGAESRKGRKNPETHFSRGQWSFVYANVLPSFLVLVQFVQFVADSDSGSSLKVHLSVGGRSLKSFFDEIACRSACTSACSLFAQSLHTTVHAFVHGLLHAICLFFVIEFELQVSI